jgi:flagellar biosynthesis protein FlhF
MSEPMEQSAASMKIKSYFSSSVEKAIQEARHEMGPEAVLLTTRRTPPENRRLGAYEVVFGLATANAGPSSSTPSVDLSAELHSLQSQLADLKNALQLGAARPQVSSSSLPEELCRELIDADLEPALARQIADEAVAAWRDKASAPRSLQGAPLLRHLAIECISKRLRLASEPLQDAKEASRLIVFVGPPGAGKTATLAKYAVQFCLAARHSVRILSVDPHRVASHEKLRALAGVIGVGFTATSSLSEFVATLEELRAKNVVLVDTPGYTRDFDGARDIRSCLGSEVHKEIHLVLPASMKRADLHRLIRQYEVFQPDCLLFTKLDETESCGAALSVALEFKKPVSFLANGQSIPEDLQRASASALTNYLISREPARATSAA